MEEADLKTAPSEATAATLVSRALGEKITPSSESTKEADPEADNAKEESAKEQAAQNDSAKDGNPKGASPKDESPKDELTENENGKDDSRKNDAGEKNDGKNAGEKNDGGEKKESCPYATKRAIVESIAEIKRFAEEHKLAASVLKSILQLLAEIALGAMRGKVSRQILEALLKAINYELAIDEAFKKGHTDGRKEFIEERYPSDDDGLPHINGGILRPEGTSIFDVAAEARR